MTPRGPKFFSEIGKIFWAGIVREFRLFLGIQVIEVAVELIETVGRGQKFVFVAQVIFAKLSGGIALFFQQLGNGGIFCPQSQIGTG